MTKTGVYGIYDDNKMYANLFLFGAGGPSAGKGCCAPCVRLMDEHDKERMAEWEQEKNEYKRARAMIDKSDPEYYTMTEPGRRLMVVPGNVTKSMLVELMSNNKKGMLMAETEADTLANSFKTDHGEYSEILRQAFHHEKASLARRKGCEVRSVKNPRLSVMLTGTPSQMVKLVKSTENGLFSRIMFYYMNSTTNFKRVLNKEKEFVLNEKFEALGKKFHAFEKRLREAREEYRFRMTFEQGEKLMEVCGKHKKNYMELYGEDVSSIINRLGLIMFRLGMALTVLRQMEGWKDGGASVCGAEMVCSDEDFEVALNIAETVLQHDVYVMKMLPGEEKDLVKKAKSESEKMVDKLPDVFCKSDIEGYCKLLNLTRDVFMKRIKRMLNNGKMTKVGDTYLQIKTNAV